MKEITIDMDKILARSERKKKIRLIGDELWALVRCSAWLESGEENTDSETKKSDAQFRKLHKKLNEFYLNHRNEIHPNDFELSVK